MKKVLVDTDIGSDIDDVLALTYLFHEPECEIVGITTVSGESKKRAMLASALCKAFGIDVPIYPGLELPLDGKQLQPLAQQAIALDIYPHEVNFPDNKAIQFLQKTIRENPHQITLLAIGPLTNIATLFQIDPEIPSLLGELVMMSGVFSDTFHSYEEWTVPEWNTRLDPVATAIVYRHIPTQNKIIGLDITTQVYMDANAVKEKLLAVLPQIITDMATIWFSERKYVVFHDPLAATAIFNDDICVFKTQNIKVDLEDQTRLGMTTIEADSGEKKQNISISVKPSVFFDTYFSVLMKRKDTKK